MAKSVKLVTQVLNRQGLNLAGVLCQPLSKWQSTHALIVARGDNTSRSLAAVARIHDPAILIQRQMETLLALDAVQREVIITTAGRKISKIFGRVRSAKPAPGAISQVEDAILVAKTVEEWLRPFERMVVMFENDRNAILLKEGHPVFAIGLAGAFLAADS